MIRSTLNTSNSAKWLLNYHFVFVTKYRRKTMNSQMLFGMESIIASELLLRGSTLTEFNGEADHVHFLAQIPPSECLSNIVQRLKIQTSRYARENHWYHVKKYLWGNHFWSPSYCVVSAGGAPLSVIQDYIRGQNRPD